MFQSPAFFSWSYTFLHPSLTSDQPPDQKDAHSTIVGSAQSIARVRLKAAGPEDGVQQSGSLDAGRSQGREIFGTRTKKEFLGEEARLRDLCVHQKTKLFPACTGFTYLSAEGSIKS